MASLRRIELYAGLGRWEEAQRETERFVADSIRHLRGLQRQLPGLQLVLEVHLAAGVQQAPDGLPPLPQIKDALIPFQQGGQLFGAGRAVRVVFVQQPLRHGDFFALLKQLVDGAQGLGGFLVVAKRRIGNGTVWRGR